MGIRGTITGVFFLCLLAPATLRAQTLTVYSALEEDEIAAYLEGAHKALPDLTIHVMRLSTGDLAARLLAESAAPRNDVVWGQAVSSLLDPRLAGLLAPLSSPRIDAMPARYRDATWYAPTGYVTAFCVNTEALASRHLPMPRTWQDLAKPVYRGEVVMPDAASSGVGFMQVSAITQVMGDRGWTLLGQIGRNVAQYTPSGSSPCKLARTGEYAIGVSLAFVALQSIDAGYPVAMVVPSDIVGYELEGSAIMKASKNKAAATRFLDYLASPDAARIYARFKTIVTVPGSKPDARQVQMGLPADLDARLAPVDFRIAARERSAIIARFKALEDH